MKEHPILFSSEMVGAILDGRKSQTRRVIKPQPEKYTVRIVQSISPVHWQSRLPIDLRALYPNSQPTDMLGSIFNCPYGQVGDRLWVRETWADGISASTKQHYAIYKASDGLLPGQVWRPSIFMPRWASRITLEITGIRVQRVQEISPNECRDEGVEPFLYKNNFITLWNRINSKRGYGWDKNPFVWVIEFKRLEK